MAEFRPNPQLERQLQQLPGLMDARRAAAEAVKQRAEAFAPVGRTREYRGSLDVVENGETIAVASSDFAAHLVEYGSVNNPPYAPLRRAARSLELRVDEQPRA